MIVHITGKLIEKGEHSLVVNVNGLHYEVLTPPSVVQRVDETLDDAGCVNLVTYHYLQIGPSSAFPVLVGFINRIECEFFQNFIKVSGIGPRAAVKALNRSISDITRAIDAGDVKFLTTLPGIGLQRAKEIVAKLQGKLGRFGLINDAPISAVVQTISQDFQEEALRVLLQLQYSKPEAADMIEKAMSRSQSISTAESLLNEIYKQKVKI